MGQTYNLNIDFLRHKLSCGKNSCQCSNLARRNNVHCPSHTDRNPSLSLGEGRDGRILMHCFAGCPNDSILKAIGLNYQHLFKSSK